MNKTSGIPPACPEPALLPACPGLAHIAVRPELVEGHPPSHILDTNIVLDLWVFDDPVSEPLRTAVQNGTVCWLATPAMREELARVLDYPHIARRLSARAMTADTVLGHFDRHAQLQPDAPKAPYACKDADDQKFIDLAVQHAAALHSKDAQVLCMKNRLARCGVPLNPALTLHVGTDSIAVQAEPLTTQAEPTTVRATPITVRAELVEAPQEN